jgi:PAS domain S-box-containing protein
MSGAAITVDNSSDMFERVTRALNVAYSEWTVGSGQIRVSTAFAEMMGYDPGTWSVATMNEWIHPDDRAAYRAELLEFFKSGAERAQFTLRFLRHGNEVRWALVHCLAERDSAGKVTRLTGTCSDITEAKQQEAQNRALLARQEASIEVLKAISASPDDPQPVFELIARRARELCGAAQSGVNEYDGTMGYLRALDGYEPAAAERMRLLYPRPPSPETISGRTILSGQIVHVRDVRADRALTQAAHDRARDLDTRSLLGVPLLREGRVIGSIVLRRTEVGGFDDNQIALVQSFAEQAMIAIASATSLRELRARTAELAQRNSEYGERIEHQSATIDVLKEMSASPGDAQPALDLIARRALELCDANGVGLYSYDGVLIHLLAAYSSSGSEEDMRRFRSQFPMATVRNSTMGRAILDRRIDHLRGLDGEPEISPLMRAQGVKSFLHLPLFRDDTVIGVIGINSLKAGGFTDSQVELLKTFAEQSVIAITSAETYRSLQERTAALAQRNSEYGEKIEHQAATIDVLKEMSASPGDPQPVFDLIVRRALVLCDAASVNLQEYDGELVHLRATHGVIGDLAIEEQWKLEFPQVPRPGPLGRLFRDGQEVHIRDTVLEPDLKESVRATGTRSVAGLPLLRDGKVVGGIFLGKGVHGGFTDGQFALLKTFAEQAVIAISSAETYRSLQERTAALAQRNSEFGERIEQQAATIDVLKVMSSTPDDTQPVFDQIARRAKELCNGKAVAVLQYYDGLVSVGATYPHNWDQNALASQAYLALFPMAPTRESIPCRAILDKQVIHIKDAETEPGLSPVVRGVIRERGYRSQLVIPLMRDGEAVGCISLTAPEPGGFSDSQVALLQTFAEQAVIAIASVANFRALRQRTAELTRSVAELQALEEVLRAVNSSLDLDTVLATIINRAVRLSQADEGMIYEFDQAEQIFVPKSAYGMTEDRVALLRERRIKLGETYLGRSAVERVPVNVDDVRLDPNTPDISGVLSGIHAVLAVPLLREDKVIGGLVIRRRTEGSFPPTTVTLMQTFAGQCVLAIENARLFQELAERGEEARRARVTAEATLTDLRRAQDRLVQSEKMASLGQLTAGIAHEIKNPLNFVNNFSDLSVDLLDELHEAVAPEKLSVAPELRAEIDEITTTLKGNLEKIAQHGRRADSIVKNMLLHSRTGPSEHRQIDLNATVEEALNLAYHGARAETPGFNIALEKHFDPAAAMIDAYPQEITRVLLNLMSNGFYAARKRMATAPPGFEPTLTVATRDLGDFVTIRVRDNGTGIPQEVREKIFEPFFTTKPAGEGTGLGLSLSYDVVVKQHNGQLTVDSSIDQFTEFTIALPRRMAEGQA